MVELFCPDSELGLSCPALKSEYLKVAHHGSDGSFEENFFRSVSPEIAVISVGKNRYGHPSLRVIKNLQRAGASVWRTDELNDIIIR